MYCSPKNSKNKYTCFSDESLIKIAKAYNKQYGEEIKIPSKFNTNIRKKIWDDIKTRLMSYSPCEDDFCLLYNPIVNKINDKDIIENTFRPEKPVEWYNNKYTWLSTTDIENVLKQYERYSDFEFIGAVPIDFDYKIGFGLCVVTELCKLDLKKILSNGKKKIGIVFNLDPHYLEGSHWTALFSDLEKGETYYFDSYGVPPPNEVDILMERITEQGNKLVKEGILNISNKKGFKSLYNNIRFQYGDSECGVFSLHFITELLDGKTFEEVLSNRITDKRVNEKRNIFYRPNINRSVRDEYSISKSNKMVGGSKGYKKKSPKKKIVSPKRMSLKRKIK
jgi:hypothetical protein